ncbi:hypothetical protein AB4Y32_25175 [Paraburkholderia phymatum]|uniref:Uncharacterized protein n=1 Tax=Paraburkholderia phymatum TaxID=148447 RepID=A0ACC6U623_9BURK
MQPDGYHSRQRLNATHVVESELQHLEWATRQPMMRRLNARYWRRRVLEVKGGYELTAQQGMRIDRMLRRLADRAGSSVA